MMRPARRAWTWSVSVVLALGLSGCGYSWQAEVRRHAAVEHACPEGQVRVLQDNGQELARQAVLEVCGDERIYLHRNAGSTYEWLDVTAEPDTDE